MAPPMDHRLLRPKASITAWLLTESGEVLTASAGERLRQE
jgi:hypothetical protein